MVYAVILPGAPALSCFGLLAVLRLLLFGLFQGLPVWFACLFVCCWEEGVEFVLCGLLFLVLAVEERVLLARWGFRRSWLFSLVLPGLRRSSRSFCIWAVFAAFSMLRGTRQVERFVACSFGICRK